MRRVEHEHVQTGRRSDEVLQNPAYQEAMRLLKEDIVRSWRDCPVRDAEGQRLLLQLAKVADKFEGILLGMIERGKHAQAMLELESARDETATRRFFRKVVG